MPLRRWPEDGVRDRAEEQSAPDGQPFAKATLNNSLPTATTFAAQLDHQLPTSSRLTRTPLSDGTGSTTAPPPPSGYVTSSDGLTAIPTRVAA